MDVNTNTSGGVSQTLMNAMNPKKATAANDVKADENKFMTLLLTQLRNQDPLNPMDNAQITSQLAQLQTVTGINKMNSTMDALRADYKSSSSLAATTMINHGVLVAGSAMQLAGGKAVFGIEMGKPADNVLVEIKDSKGVTIHSINIDKVNTGVMPLVWDGTLADGKKAPDGAYRVAVTATNGTEVVKEAGTLTFGTVASVSTGAAGIKLNIPGIGQLTMDDIKQVL